MKTINRKINNLQFKQLLTKECLTIKNLTDRHPDSGELHATYELKNLISKYNININIMLIEVQSFLISCYYCEQQYKLDQKEIKEQLDNLIEVLMNYDSDNIYSNNIDDMFDYDFNA